MSSRSGDYSPWPAQTPLPTPSSSRTGNRKRGSVDEGPSQAMTVRAVIANISEIDQAKARCFNTDNSVLSCWPEGGVEVFQNQATQFVWNSRHPILAQLGSVDIALVRADTGETVTSTLNVPNPTDTAGWWPVVVDDEWWGSSGPEWIGGQVPFPFNFIIVQKGSEFNSLPAQSTFFGIQTTLPASIIASSASAASSSSSVAASLSSASLTAVPSGSSISGPGGGSGSSTAGHGGSSGLQNANGASSSFPHWAIAVIVVLGFFALAAFIALIFLIFARMRRRDVSRRGSLGSQSPMMANVEGGEPSLASPQMSTGHNFATGAALGGLAAGHAASTVSPDGASTHSDSPFSGADAAVMAEAFRKALRKPDFGDRPVEEGESPDAPAGGEQGDPPELLNRELAEEGRDIRSVASTRTPRVETLVDDSDTATARDSQI